MKGQRWWVVEVGVGVGGWRVEAQSPGSFNPSVCIDLFFALISSGSVVLISAPPGEIPSHLIFNSINISK